jgi:hypothetical protein
MTTVLMEGRAMRSAIVLWPMNTTLMLRANKTTMAVGEEQQTFAISRKNAGSLFFGA